MINKALPLRDFSAFKDWNWTRLDDTRVCVWSETRCEECNESLILNEYAFFEPDDASLNLSGVNYMENKPKLRRAVILFAGGPCHCPFHYAQWLHGKILPSENVA